LFPFGQLGKGRGQTIGQATSQDLRGKHIQHPTVHLMRKWRGNWSLFGCAFCTTSCRGAVAVSQLLLLFGLVWFDLTLWSAFDGQARVNSSFPLPLLVTVRPAHCADST